jgi:serine/threonine protein kinase
LNSLGKVDWQQIKSDHSTNSLGYYNQIRFFKINHIRVATRQSDGTSALMDEKIGLDVVFSQPKSYLKEYVNQAIKSHSLVARIPDDFNHIYLFQGTNNERISEKAACDFHDFVTMYKNQLDLAAVTRLVGQVLLATHDYHSRNIVHRDIKIENFLIFYREKKYYLKLSDQDTAIEVNDDGTRLTVEKPSFCGSPGYLAPETGMVIKEGEKLRFEPSNDYPNLNFKTVDCYAVGYAIRMLYYHALKSFDLDVNEYLKKLTDFLSAEKPEDRGTIQQAMNSELFAKTTVEREQFFTALRAEAKRELIIDGEVVDSKKIKINDAFFLLDSRIKPIIRTAQQLDEEIDGYQQSQTKEKLETLQQHKNALVSSIKQLKTTPMPLFHADLIFLEEVAEEEVRVLTHSIEATKAMSIDFVEEKTDTLKQNTGRKRQLSTDNVIPNVSPQRFFQSAPVTSDSTDELNDSIKKRKHAFLLLAQAADINKVIQQVRNNRQ